MLPSLGGKFLSFKSELDFFKWQKVGRPRYLGGGGVTLGMRCDHHRIICLCLSDKVGLEVIPRGIPSFFVFCFFFFSNETIRDT